MDNTPFHRTGIWGKVQSFWRFSSLLPFRRGIGQRYWTDVQLCLLLTVTDTGSPALFTPTFSLASQAEDICAAAPSLSRSALGEDASVKDWQQIKPTRNCALLTPSLSHTVRNMGLGKGWVSVLNQIREKTNNARVKNAEVMLMQMQFS